ncbi:hypothetical protein ES708_21847 [subsurface metagenome]
MEIDNTITVQIQRSSLDTIVLQPGFSKLGEVIHIYYSVMCEITVVTDKERREVNAVNHLLSYARALPGDCDVVRAGIFLVQDFNVVLLAGGQGNRGGLLLGVLIPLAPVYIAGHICFCNQGGVFGVAVGAKPQFAVSIAGNPEGVAAGCWRIQITTDTCPIGIGPVRRPFEAFYKFASGGVVGEIRVRGQVADRAAGYARPPFAKDSAHTFIAGAG